MELNKIYCGDCIELLSKAYDDGLRVDLIFADPPFNIGYRYDVYEDRKEYDEYLEWSSRWIGLCKDILKDDGSFYIAIGDEYVAELRIIARKLGLYLRNWIIWHYTFGQQTKKKFSRAHTHILYFVKDRSRFKFNADAIRVPSARQLVYSDKRANSKGKIPDDVWRYSRVCGTFKEREGWHSCQMPLKLLARIIKVSSNPGDIVLDPFVGSGTTAVAAAILGRRFVGIDISPRYVELSRRRLQEVYKQGLANTDIDCSEPVYVRLSTFRGGIAVSKNRNKTDTRFSV